MLTLSSIDSSEETAEEMLNKDILSGTSNKNSKHNTKSRRTRANSPGNLTENWLRPAEKLLDGFILSYDQTYSLIENIYNNTDPLSIIQEYTKETSQIIEKLKELHAYTKSRSAKVRLTKIINSINLQLDEETSSEQENLNQKWLP